MQRTHLDQKLVPPAVKRLETLARVDVVHQDAAIRTAVESDTEGLEALLSGRVPELMAREKEEEGNGKKRKIGREEKREKENEEGAVSQ